MNSNAVRKQADFTESKVAMPTSFGPEETDHIVLSAIQKDRKMKQGQRLELTN